MNAKEILKAVSDRVMSLTMYGDPKPRAEIEEQALDEIAAELRLRPQSIAQLSSEATTPVARFVDSETRRHADHTRDILMSPLNITIDDADEYINDREKVRALLEKDGPVGNSFIDAFIEGLKQHLRKPAPPDNAPPKVTLTTGADIVPLRRDTKPPRVVKQPEPPAPAPAAESWPLLYTGGDPRGGVNINSEFRDSLATRNWRLQNERS